MNAPDDRFIRAAARNVRDLDANASIGMEDTIMIDGLPYTGKELLHNVARNVSYLLGLHYGMGSWAASSALRKTTKRDVSVALAILGASPFTVEQFANRIAGLIRSRASVGGDWLNEWF